VEESVDPETRETTKIHCKNIIQSIDDAIMIPWVYEAAKINHRYDKQVLARVLLGELPRADLAERVFAESPVTQDDPTFNCIVWVQQALSRLNQAKIAGTGIMFDWDSIEKTALEFVQMKKLQGRYETDWKGDSLEVATFDMIVGRETVP
jgi:hypothetical protein